MQHASYIKLASVVKFSSQSELGSVAGPVIQANLRLTFKDDLRSGGLPTSLHSELVSTLSLGPVWSHQGKLGVTEC